MTDKLEQKIKILEILRVVNPIFMFGIVLFAFHWLIGLPLVLAVSIACIFAIVAFTVLSIVLSVHRKKL